MKKILIGMLIASSLVVLAGCGDASNQAASTEPKTTQTEQVKAPAESPKTDSKDNTVSKSNEDTNKDKTSDSTKKDSNDNIKKDSDKTSNEDAKAKDVHIKDTKKAVSTPSNNLVVEKRVKSKTTSSNLDKVSAYYGTWKISEVIGSTPLNTNSTAPLNKTINISKDSYSNNSFGVNIKKPIYNIAKVSSEDFCRGFKMSSLKGTGLNNGPVTALDISSPDKNNPQFDEVYLQDGSIIYLEGGMFFKCVKEK